MILQVAADVATIQHIAHARDATSNGVTPATRAGNATGRGMNSTSVLSFPRAVGVLEAIADLSDHIEKHSVAAKEMLNCYRAFS